MRVKERGQRTPNNGAMKSKTASGFRARDGMTSRNVTLDVRGMSPPEPIERVLETIDDFGPGDRLVLVIDCMPQPLFRILERNGYGHREEPGVDSLYKITIWRKPDAE